MNSKGKRSHGHAKPGNTTCRAVFRTETTLVARNYANEDEIKTELDIYRRYSSSGVKAVELKLDVDEFLRLLEGLAEVVKTFTAICYPQSGKACESHAVHPI